jgi:hypothetical protein
VYFVVVIFHSDSFVIVFFKTKQLLRSKDIVGVSVFGVYCDEHFFKGGDGNAIAFNFELVNSWIKLFEKLLE